MDLILVDLTVNDTKPIFFYCAAPNHCQKGMFGVVYVFPHFS